MIVLQRLACLLLMSTLLVACGSGGGSSASDQIVGTPSGVDDPSSDPDAEIPANIAAHATLMWSAPSQREDGTALDPGDIASYEIYHIEDTSGDMDVIEVAGDTSEYNIGLAAGSHQLAVAVVDIYGTKSQMSELQTVEIN